MNPIEKDNIFGIKEAPNFSTDGLELRYEVERGREGRTYLWQRVYRDKDGNYYLTVKGGRDVIAMLTLETYYYPGGREVLIPVRPEALGIWYKFNLYGDGREQAEEEFNQARTGRRGRRHCICRKA